MKLDAEIIVEKLLRLIALIAVSIFLYFGVGVPDTAFIVGIVCSAAFTFTTSYVTLILP